MQSIWKISNINSSLVKLQNYLSIQLNTTEGEDNEVFNFGQ